MEVITIKDYDKFIEIPEDQEERLEYIYKILKVKDKDIEKMNEEIDRIKKIKKKREVVDLTFYVVPEGIARPRLGKFGTFYVPNIKKFYDIMKEYMKKHKELEKLMIFTECKMDCKYYFPMTSDMTKVEKILAERKFIKYIKKPDWDNVGKSTDMLHKIWLDDALVTDARVRKYYSFKPRIEIRILYYKTSTNSYHEKLITKLLKKKGDKK